MAYGELKEIKKSRKAFKRGLKLYPDSLDNRFGFALALADEGDMEGAVKELETILKIDPDHISAKTLLDGIKDKNGE